MSSPDGQTPSAGSTQDDGQGSSHAVTQPHGSQGYNPRRGSQQGASVRQPEVSQIQTSSDGSPQAEDPAQTASAPEYITGDSMHKGVKRPRLTGTSLSHDTSPAGDVNVIEAAEVFWRQCVRDWYPYMHKKTYFLPPMNISRVPCNVQTVANQSVLIPQAPSDQPSQTPAVSPDSGPPRPPQPSDPPLASCVFQPVPPGPLPVVYDADVRDDCAMRQVLGYIQELATSQQEAMLVLSQLEFRQYLDSAVNPVTAAAIRLLPRSAELRPASHCKGKTPHRGNFDVLIISRQYGLIVGEVKAVGADLSKIPHLDKAVVKVMQKSIQQLNKEGNMLKHLVSGLAPVRIIKTLMVPNLTSAQLVHALNTSPDAQQDMCTCLGVTEKDVDAAVCRCLCSDSTPGDWWRHTVTHHGADQGMTPDKYETLVARFCGPATTIEVPTVTTPRRTVLLRTLSDAVARTGLTMAMLTLYPQQVDLLNSPGLPLVFLWGPPGTGKTVVLVLKGLQWGRQGKDVHVLSSHRHSRSVTMLIAHQLLQTPEIGFTDMPVSGTLAHTTSTHGTRVKTETPVSVLQVETSTSPSATLVQSATPESDTQVQTTLPSGPRVYTHLYDFDHVGDVEAAVNELATKALNGELFVIADEAFCDFDNTSGSLGKFCTQLLVRVPALNMWSAAVLHDVIPNCLVEKRLTIPVRCPPAVLREVADSSLIDGIRIPSYSSSPAPSATDGPAVRRLPHNKSLEDDRRLRHSGEAPENCTGCFDAVVDLLKELKVGQQGHDLQYRDVIIMYDEPTEDLPVVKRLQERGLPVHVVSSRGDEAAIRDVALAARDAVTVTDWEVLRGLERRVVVMMWWGVIDDVDRLLAMSRCTSLLVWVGDPIESDVEDDDDTSDD